MNYRQANEYLGRFSNYEKKAHQLKARFSLDPIRELTDRMEHPEKHYPSVHVAGTVGKGSVCHMLDAALNAAGFKSGLYTSPHLNDIRERIRVCGKMISKQDFADAVSKVSEAVCEEYDTFTYFEVLTAAAFEIFEQKKIDIAIVETGLGGRLDATNAVDSTISVITPIGWDHQHILGNRLSDIAFEKAGIIKPGTVTVTAPQRPSAMKVIKDTCDANRTKLVVANPCEKMKSAGGGNNFIVTMKGGDPFAFQLPLAGEFQKINLATVICTIEELNHKGFKIGTEDVRRGIETMVLPGRMEAVESAKNGLTYILDGAHNRTAAKSLSAHIAKNSNGKRIIMIVGMMRDKDCDSVMKELNAISSTIIICGLPLDRAWTADDLARFAKKYFSRIIKAESMNEALKASEKIANKKDIVYVTGSLYAVAEARASLMLV
jgi:dihydrofolate synthase / folylpolyglutamate synthase